MPNQKWSRERIINELKKLAENEGKDYLKDSSLHENETALYSAIRRYFDGLKEAVEEAGFNYEEICSTKVGGWNKEKIIDKLQKRAERKGLESLRPSELKENSPLYGAIRNHYGGCRLAVEEAGFDYDNIIARKPNNYWSKENIIEWIRNQSKEELSYSEVEGKSVVNAANRKFGSWRKAIEEAGIEVEEVYQKQAQNYWSADKVVEKIQELYNGKTESVTAKKAREDYNVLYQYASDFFGSWVNAVNEAGIEADKEDLLRQEPGKWDKETFSEEFEEYVSKNSKSSLNPKTVLEKKPELYRAGRMLYGSWKSAVKAEGYDPLEVYQIKSKYWTEEKILEKIKNIADEKGRQALSTRRMAEEGFNDVLSAAEVEFGSWRKAIEEAGFDYSQIMERKERGHWSKENIIAALRKIEADEVMVSKAIEDKGGLRNAASREFGSLQEALEAAGYNADEIYENKPNGYWTKEKIKKKIQNLFENKGREAITATVAHKKHTDIYQAAKNNIGSWEDAVEMAGINYGSIKKSSGLEDYTWGHGKSFARRCVKSSTMDYCIGNS